MFFRNATFFLFPSSTSALIREHLGHRTNGDSLAGIKKAMKGKALRGTIDGTLGSLIQRGQIHRTGPRGKAWYTLVPGQPEAASRKSAPTSRPNDRIKPSASVRDASGIAATIDALESARRAADFALRSLAASSSDAHIRQAAILAIELNDRVDALVNGLRL